MSDPSQVVTRNEHPNWGAVDEAADALRRGNSGKLEFGGHFLAHEARGYTYNRMRNMLKDQGVSPPSHSSASKWKRAYRAWTEDANLSPDEPIKNRDYEGGRVNMTLTGVAIEKLYHLAPLVEEAPEDAGALLAYAYNNSDAKVRNYAKGHQEGPERKEGDPQIKMARYDAATQRVLKLPTGVMEDFQRVVDRVRSNQGDPNITPIQVFEFMVSVLQSDTTADESLDYLWRNAHGELSEEEVEASEQVYVDVE